MSTDRSFGDVSFLTVAEVAKIMERVGFRGVDWSSKYFGTNVIMWGHKP